MTSNTLDADSIRDRIHHFGKAGVRCDANEDLRISRLCEVGKDFLRRRCTELVVSAARRHLLFTYSADGTPLRTTGTVRGVLAGTQRVVRRGGKGEELLIQRGYVLTHNASGALVSAPLLREALPLSAGKGSWNVFTAATRFFPHLRQIGHESICIHHGCFDRALHSAMTRKLAQRQALYYDEVMGPASGVPQGTRRILEWSDWYVQTPCAAHDCQNSLKWGMNDCVVNIADVMKRLYIVLASCRNSYSLFYSNLHSFLRESFIFTDEGIPSTGHLVELWGSLGRLSGSLRLVCPDVSLFSLLQHH